MTIKEVYEKYKHFDKFFCDRAFLDSMQAQARYDMWQAIRAAGQDESAPTDVQHTTPPAPPCTWTHDGDAEGKWDSECGESFQFSDGGPTENEYIYCPGCGGVITVK